MPAATQQTVDDSTLMDDKGAFSQSAEGTPTQKTATSADNGKVKVKIGEQEIETDAASAQIITTLSGELQNLAGMVQQLQQASRQTPTTQQKSTQKAEEYDFSTGIFTEPAVAIAKLTEQIREQVKAEVVGMYQSAESSKDFWSTFYSDNKDLKEEKIIVDAVLSRDYSKLSNLPTAEAAKKLAESAKKELLRLKGGKSDSDAQNTGFEGGSAKGAPARVNAQPQNQVSSLSEVIRKRQEARRKATFSKE